MGLLSSLPVIGDLAGKVMDKISPDKAEARQQQTELNKTELEGAPQSKLRLWRSFLGWTLALVFAWEVAIRPVIVTYWPDVTLPPSALKEIVGLLYGMLGLGF